MLSTRRRADMQISEARLRQIIVEEVRNNLVEYYTEKEIQVLFEDSDDPEVQKDREEYRRLARQGKKIPAGLALALGLGVGGLKMATDQHADTLGAQHDARVSQNIDAANTDDAQFKELVKQLNNQYAFRWGKGNDSVVHAPGSDGKVTVLPPSYSVMVKVMQDKKMNAERIEQGLEPLQRFGEVDTELRAKDIYQADKASGDFEDKGDMDKEVSNFFKVHKGNFVDAMKVVGAYDELQVVPGSGMEQAIIMVNPDQIDANTYLPAVGMSAGDYYNLQYGEYMGDGEKAALDGPEEEESFDPTTELNPELIQVTNKRAQKYNMKESKVTWKNYKNRKKVLA